MTHFSVGYGHERHEEDYKNIAFKYFEQSAHAFDCMRRGRATIFSAVWFGWLEKHGFGVDFIRVCKKKKKLL